MNSAHVARSPTLHRPSETLWATICPLRRIELLSKDPLRVAGLHARCINCLGPAASSSQPVAIVAPLDPITASRRPVQPHSRTILAAVPVPQAAPPSFEPQLPGTNVLAAQGLVLALTVVAAGYWWLVVVPSERAALGRSKRLGTLNSYLQELERPEATQERWLERWFYTDWLRQRQKRRQQRSGAAAAADVEDSSSAGDPYDTSQLEEPNLLRPSASTPTPRFLSLDNPIVATAALLALAVAAAGLQQR